MRSRTDSVRGRSLDCISHARTVSRIRQYGESTNGRTRRPHLARRRADHFARGELLIRRRPIPRSRDYPTDSLRYTSILNGAVRVYPDGREVCQDSPAGWREYKRRVEAMLLRQQGRCCLCGKRLALREATFEHQRRRGMGAAWRDDRIFFSKDGQDWNGAAHWVCNSEKG